MTSIGSDTPTAAAAPGLLGSLRSGVGRWFVPGVVLAVWTLLLWSTRIRNIVDDTALVGWSRTWQFGISVVFIVVAAVLGVLSLVRPSSAIGLGLILAVFGSGWWIVRGAGVVLADHDLAFTVVHVALAIGTVAISAWLIRGHRSRFACLMGTRSARRW